MRPLRMRHFAACRLASAAMSACVFQVAKVMLSQQGGRRRVGRAPVLWPSGRPTAFVWRRRGASCLGGCPVPRTSRRRGGLWRGLRRPVVGGLAFGAGRRSSAVVGTAAWVWAWSVRLRSFCRALVAWSGKRLARLARRLSVRRRRASSRRIVVSPSLRPRAALHHVVVLLLNLDEVDAQLLAEVLVPLNVSVVRVLVVSALRHSLPLVDHR